MSVLPTRSGWIHAPVGLATVAICAVNAPLGILFGTGFLFYELLQEYLSPTSGNSHEDVQGWLYGIAIGTTIWFIISN